MDVLRQPNRIFLFAGGEGAGRRGLQRSGDRWTGAGIEVNVTPSDQANAITMHAPSAGAERLHLRWEGAVREGTTVLGDAWERSYGDLGWMPIEAERCLPWYCLTNDGTVTHGYGVRTGAGSFAFWQVDKRGVSLWLDVRNGGNAVEPGDRVVPLATVVMHEGKAGESSLLAAKQFCRAMATGITLPKARGTHSLNAIFGSNDWYYAYGKNTSEGILRDADLMADTAPGGVHRPFTVVDDGYQDRTRFPDMAALASRIRDRGVVPGIWIRPLRAAAETKPSLLLPKARWGKKSERGQELAFDPTVPEASEAVLDVVRQAAKWGYDLIKHDFTTYELLGQWGFEMGPSPTLAGWNFHDRTQTNAEIVGALYRDVRKTAGEDRIVLGCNTVGHLGVGLFDAQRTGDDVSGRDWERTRRMGVNTLAFRLPQNRSFFATDADCVPITRDVPWEMTRQWLEVVAKSGTVLLVSPEPDAVGSEQRRALREAFAMCAAGAAEPQDWMKSRTPEYWKDGEKGQHYTWTEMDGESPFPV